MCGRLLGDFIGIDFDHHDVQLVLRTYNTRGWEFDAVASDVIVGRLDGSRRFCLTFAAEDAVVGYCPADRAVPVLHGDLLQELTYDCCRVFYRRGAAYALASDGVAGTDLTRFAMVRDANPDEAARRAEQLMKNADIDGLCARARARKNLGVGCVICKFY
jgi:hypothetical protein